MTENSIYGLKYDLLVNYPAFSFLNRWLRPKNWIALALTKRRIETYNNFQKVKKLHIGCGRNHLDGWLNADICHGDIYLNASKGFPLIASSMDFIFSEHFIEHLTANDGFNFLKECYRVLKPSGVMRLSTPDLRFYIDLYLENETEVSLDQFCSRIRPVFPKTPDKCTFVNRILVEFGHLFNYDFDHLKSLLLSLGFSQVTRVKYGESKYQELRHLESHSQAKWYQDKATLLIETVK